MLVYRVEHRKRLRGPYESLRIMLDWCPDAHENRPNWPIPKEDGITYARGYRYGFKDLRQLRAWFSDDHLHALSYMGYVINMYEIPSHAVEKGKSQLIFSPHAAILRDTLDMGKVIYGELRYA